jgi:NTP pyrophosphatase (non-canonical NTP hydrolase)
MDFEAIRARALEVRRLYAAFEQRRHGRSWSAQELAVGFVGDVGDLAKLVLAKSGVRSIDGADEKLAHELADCLWSVIVLADAYGVDLEKSFAETMDQLERWLEARLEGER